MASQSFAALMVSDPHWQEGLKEKTSFVLSKAETRRDWLTGEQRTVCYQDRRAEEEWHVKSLAGEWVGTAWGQLGSFFFSFFFQKDGNLLSYRS